MNKTNKYISIGGLAAGSGVPVETIRNWELRYDFPKPIRLDSGHRRYEMELIQTLRKIKSLVDLGYKPSFAVNLDDDELDKLLLSGGVHINTDATGTMPPEQTIEYWLTLTDAMNGAELSRTFARDWHSIGARRFIFELALPFLRKVGARWENAAISVAKEHFASEVLQSFLSARWRPLVSSNHKRRILLANQEGELHSLGLQMAALLASLHNIEPIFLGPNTPLKDIVDEAAEQKVNAVIIGLSAVSEPRQSTRFLQALQRGLIGVRLAFGGNEQLPELSNIEYIESLETFDTWCQKI